MAKKVKTQEIPEAKVTKPLYIIAIGASAGGLEALQEFLSHLPELDNCSIIVAQHLSPTHKSMLVQLLSRETQLVVAEAENGKLLERNKVYITPPDKEITVVNGTIILNRPSAQVGPKPSVDILFQSLAKSSASHVIGVILSGTGSDGALGVKAIKNNGGYIIVQEPGTAKYDGMPLAAIQTEMVDAVLAPEKMGEEIAEYLADPMRARIKPQHLEEAGSAMNKILRLLSKRTGTDFSNYKSATIGRRLAKRMAMLNLTSIEDYLKVIESQPQEADEMFNMILIGVTNFFRDKEAFQAINNTILDIVSPKVSRDTIRIWVPGCSTGEEPYSIAILLHEILKEKISNFNIQIFATDIDEKAIAFARKGYYNKQSLESVSKDIIAKYFLKKGNEYELIKSVRSLVLFSKHDVTKNPPFLKQDLISCRNLLIYFNTALQQQIMPVFHYAINQDGYLFLGKSETVGQYSDLFATIDAKNKIFKRKRGGNLHTIKFAAFKPTSIALPKAVSTNRRGNLSVSEMVKETLFNTFEHPYVVVNSEFDIQEVNGDVRLFMSLSPGSIQINLLRMVNTELQIELRSILAKTVRERSIIRSNIKKFELFGNMHFVRLTSQPLIYSDGTEELFIVIFERLDINEFLPYGFGEENVNITDSRIQELEHELTATKEHLQTYIEEIETSNEELQSLNEELQSTNEELQSSNEELETSNEELQSTNEEMQIAYTELKTAHEELAYKEKQVQVAQANAKALLSNELQGMLLLDTSYKIELFNSKAREILFTISGKEVQVSSSIIDFLPVSAIESFIVDCKAAIAGKKYSTEKAITSANGNVLYFSTNYTPVRNDANEVIGISLAMLDTNALVQANYERTVSENLINAVFNAVSIGICITNAEGYFVQVNDQYCQLYGYSREEIIGKHFTMMVADQHKQMMTDLHDTFIAGGEEPPSEFEVVNKAGERIKIAVFATLLTQPDGSRFKVTSVRRI